MKAKGFTLIELMIVVMIIGILAVFVIPIFSRMIARSKEAAVRSNCHTVQLAAEDFAVQNEGVYAADVGADVTQANQSITDMLPGGALLENPFTKAATEPVDGVAANAGESAYAPIVQNNVNVGYSITGVGKEANTIIITVSSGQ